MHPELLLQEGLKIIDRFPFPHVFTLFQFFVKELDLPELTCEQINLLPIYSRGLTELGIDGRSYLDTQRWQSQVSGGISAHVSAKGSLNHMKSLSGHLTISTKGLVKNQAALKELIQATLEKPRFD